MKANKLIKNTIIAVCSLAITSPLFMDRPFNQVVSANDHPASSLYRSIASIQNKGKSKEKRKNNESNKDQFVDKEITLCENKKKIEDLSIEIKKLEDQKEEITKIVGELEGKDSKENLKQKSQEFSNDNLSQLLMQQLYLNNILAQSLMNQQQRPQGTYFGDARWISGSNSSNMSSSALTNYASMALYNQLAFKVQGNQMWTPQFNKNGYLSNPMYDVQASNPYSNSYVNVGQRLGMNNFPLPF